MYTIDITEDMMLIDDVDEDGDPAQYCRLPFYSLGDQDHDYSSKTIILGSQVL